MDSARFARQDELTTELAADLSQLADVLRAEQQLSQRADAVRQHAQRVAEDRFTIVVVGDFNRGKSTLLNALLGQKILPQKVVPSTAVITKIEFGEQPSASVMFNVAGMQSKDMSWEAFKAEYILKEEDHHGKDKASTERFEVVDYATVRFPVGICKHRVALVDTPGLNDHQVRTARTSRFLESADAVVMVLDATRLFTHQERTFVDYVRDALRQRTIFFLVNFWNLVEEMSDEPAAESANIEKRLYDTASPYCLVDGVNRFADRVFRINPKKALELRSTGKADRVGLEESGIPQFESSLNDFLLNERAAVRNENALQTALAAHHKYHNYAEERLRLLKESVEVLESRKVVIEPELQRLRRLRAHIEQILSGHSLKLQEELLASLRETLRTVDVGKAVDSFNLTEITGRFLAAQVVLDTFRSEEEQFKARVESQIKPQVDGLIRNVLASWQARTATKTMVAEAKELEVFLAAEAEEYRQIVRQIELKKSGVDQPMVDVKNVIEEWLKGDWGVTKAPLLSGKLLSGSLIDISPLLAGVAADVALHLTAHMFPVIGTMASLILGWWRNAGQKRAIVENLKLELASALGSMPDRSQEKNLRSQVKAAYDELSQVVTKNIAANIVETEGSLDSVIEAKKRETFNFDQEQKRLSKAEHGIKEILTRMQVKVMGGKEMRAAHAPAGTS